MELTVSDFVELSNVVSASSEKAFQDGVESEKRRDMPNSLFEAVIEYGKKTKTLVDYHKSSSKTDGLNWIQLQPTREGSEGIDSIEISFEENLNEIDHIGVNKSE